jgi:hypothetical protein
MTETVSLCGDSIRYDKNRFVMPRFVSLCRQSVRYARNHFVVKRIAALCRGSIRYAKNACGVAARQRRDFPASGARRAPVCARQHTAIDQQTRTIPASPPPGERALRLGNGSPPRGGGIAVNLCKARQGFNHPARNYPHWHP